MTCRELTEFLMEYLSGAIPQAQRAMFDDHLAQCADCVNYVRTYEQTVRLGKAAFDNPDADVPEDVPEPLVKAIRAARKRGRG